LQRIAIVHLCIIFIFSQYFSFCQAVVESKEKRMSVKIRLRRTGKLNAACHRIVVADSRSPRDGRFIENIGFYDPRHKNEKIDLARVDYWLPRGAQPSETVSAIIKRARAGKSMGSNPTATPAAATESVE
jgi:small subunit ribosomal protein S16